MRRNFAIAMAAAAAATVTGASFAASAQTCTERCAASYQSCAALEAAGCEIGGQLAGDAAAQLGGELPIPGMGALFGSLARTTTAQGCVELLGPCKQILATCLAGCPAAEGQAPGAAAPAPARRSTLRVFADRPRCIVYINEQRMGATPDDALQPFVSPELPVGRYWVRLASPDGQWEWRGEKTVEEGNLNAVEGTLANRRSALLEKARGLDGAGETVRAAAAYRELRTAFPDDPEIRPEAEARLAALLPAFQAADAEMSRRIAAEAEPQKRATLCRVYLEEFAGGAFRPQVQATLDELERTLPRPRQPGDPAQPLVDDRAQVEAVIGADLSQEYGIWQRYQTAMYPRFSDAMIAQYERRRKDAVVLATVFSVIGVAAVIVGPVLIVKSEGRKDDDYLIAGAIVTGEGGLLILLSATIGPVKATRAKRNKGKVEAMHATALRTPRLELVGLSPLLDGERAVRGVAAGWSF